MVIPVTTVVQFNMFNWVLQIYHYLFEPIRTPADFDSSESKDANNFII